MRPADLRRRLLEAFPWASSPLIVSAPMRVMSGPDVAVSVSSAGGLGFIGPSIKPADMFPDLEKAESLLSASPIQHHEKGDKGSALLPIGVGFQTWNGDLAVSTEIVKKHRPCAVWLFAPKNGQAEFDEWAAALRAASPGTQIWLQVGTLGEALEAARTSSATAPDVLVIQGSEAGGHGRAKDGMGTMALFPEVVDAVTKATSGASGIPIIAAGGIIDGRGVAAAHSLGAAGTAMGTRFLAATEARIAKGYQDEVVRASDGATSTVRTQLYNHLRGTFGWPEHWSPRGVINKSWTDHEAGVPFDELKKRHDEVTKLGDAAWGPEGRTATYAGAGVGLVKGVEDASVIVKTVREDARSIIKSLADEL